MITQKTGAMAFKIAAIGVVLLLAAGCAGASAGGSGADSGGDSGVPAGDQGAIDGTGYSYMALDYEGPGLTPGKYATLVVLTESEDVYLDVAQGDVLRFSVLDSSDGIAIDPGSYDHLMSFPIFEINPGPTSTGYAASIADESTYEGSWGPVDAYDQITGGSLTVSTTPAANGTEYAFSWNFSTASGTTLIGSYTSVPDSTLVP